MDKSLRILHLEDLESDSDLIERELKKGKFPFEYLWVSNKKMYEESLDSFLPDLILSDHSLPSFTSADAFNIIKNKEKRIPFIIVSATVSEEFVIQMMKEGVDDYILKDRLMRLPNAVLNAIEKISTENSKLEYNKIIISQEKRFRALIENLTEAILLINENAEIVYQGSSTRSVTGFDYEEIKNKRIFTFFHPEDIEEAAKIFKLSFSKPGIPLRNSFRLIHKKGHSILVEGTIINLLKDENVKAFILNYRDITERRKDEQRLLKSEANLRTIFDNTNVGYVLLDKNFNIVSFNQRAYSEVKKETGEILSEEKNFLDFLQEERKEFLQNKRDLILKGKKANYEISYPQADGSLAWYKVSFLPVYSNNKNLLGLIITTENITHRKNTELEKEKMSSDIMQHNKNLEQFAYIISHNLRSPVANIMGLSNLMQNTPDMNKADFNRCLDGLALSVRKMDNTIIDLNNILQVKNGVNEKKEIVKFSALVKNIKIDIQDLIKKENIEIKTNFINENEFFTIKSYLNSIFYNLISNSIKYRDPERSALIEIIAKKNNGKLLLVFKDNGLGIDLKTFQSKIFGLYKKFHPNIEGKGLGLYMVKTQVEILGGKINVYSEVDKGTEFQIEFNI
jgi:PAS domain S-box-containing protein